MNENYKTENPNYWKRSIIAFFFFISFAVTIPPLGFLGILDAIGILGDPSTFFEMTNKGDLQTWITGGLILIYGFACIAWVYLKNSKYFFVGTGVLLFFSVSSLGGCAIMLGGLDGLGG